MTTLSSPPRPAQAAAPAAVRFSRPGWRDPRLVVGVLLVCVSVALGARLLAADDLTRVWAVRDDVSAGETVTPADLRAVGVRFHEAADAERYVSAQQPVPEGTVASRDLAAGEMLPLTAIGPEAEPLLELPVAVAGGGVPATLATGDRVDVWVVPLARTSQAAPRAEQVLSDVPVLRVGRRGLGGPEATRQVVVGVDAGAELAGAVGRLADSHVVLVRRP